MGRLASLLGFHGPLTGADRKRWAQARTRADLGELTAQWLEGEIASQPGYYGAVDVDEADAPGLTAALVACNRHGYVTASSQAGWVGEGYGGHTWTQVAAVTGYAAPETVGQIKATLRGYTVVGGPLRRRRGRGVVVTWCERSPYTTFGSVSLADAQSGYDGCSSEAIRELRSAWTVTVFDPVSGRNTLWRDLERAARRWSR